MHQDKLTTSKLGEIDGSSDRQPQNQTQDRLTIRLNIGTQAPGPIVRKPIQVMNKELPTIMTLPDNILSHIFSHLDLTPPSLTKSQQRPTSYYTSSRFTYLKDISQVSKRLRSLCIPHLFRHCHLDIDELTQFLHFTNKHNLRRVVNSVTILYDESTPPELWWIELFSALKIARLTIHAEPKAFSELTGIEVQAKQEWAFDMPYQTLTLQQSTQTTIQPIAVKDPPQTLLHCRTWHTLTFNEGSFLAAYSAPESVRHNVPSFLSTLYKQSHHLARVKLTSGQGLERPHLTDILSHITTFHYIAIFPFSTHISKILKLAKKMKLQNLYVKLCPDIHSHSVSTDEIVAANSLNYVDSMWEELEKSYTIIAQGVEKLYMEGSLIWFRTGDVGEVGTGDRLMDDQLMRSTVMNCLFSGFAHLSGWQFGGFGVWRKVYA